MSISSILSETFPDIDDVLSDHPLTKEPNTFTAIMRPAEPFPVKVIKDKCNRLTPIYNGNYNPEKLAPEDQLLDYSPYAFREPLFDDRAAIISRLPRRHVLASAPKRARSSWI
jgi:hypothetical protein